MALRVGTFNLLHGLSLADGTADAHTLADAVATLEVDVLGIQEVDRGQPRSGLVDQTALVADAVGAKDRRFVPALHGTPGVERDWVAATDADDAAAYDGAVAAAGRVGSAAAGGGPGSAGPGSGRPSYGIGLVSRLPVRSWHVRRFPPAPLGAPLLVPGSRGLVHVPDEPRCALAAVLDGPAGPFTVVTAHLSFVPGWNLGQLRRVTRWAATLPAPRFLVGDLNVPGRVPARVTGWTRLARVPTYPSYRPRVQFDHALGHGLDGTRVEAMSSHALGVSDHCALTVDLLLRRPHP